MDIYSVFSTSKATAQGESLVLRETLTTRLIFKPLIVENQRNARQPVKGSFVFQRKRKGDRWEDHNELQLSNLRAEEWVKLDLSSAELDALMHHVAGLYRLYQAEGVPKGKTRFVKVDDETISLEGIDFPQLLKLAGKVEADVFAYMVDWALKLGNARDVLARLGSLATEDLQRLNSLVGLSALKRVLAEWEANQTNATEEFWQRTLQANAFVLSQVFAFPILIIKEKAYIGGKMVDNQGGHLADFLAANPITRNAVIIEIKSPTTKILGKAYRAGVYSTSEELSGAINQVVNYRYSLVTDFLSIRREHEGVLDVFSPQCLVIAGHAGRELTGIDQRKTFEMLRHNTKDVLVITYDELFAKTRLLIETLEGDGN
jgi:hypothetical protein